MKQWRPHLDLDRLSSALAEEIVAASEDELREVSARSGHSLAGAAGEVRGLIAAANDERGYAVTQSARHTALARQH